jgi:hypothetical protein
MMSPFLAIALAWPAVPPGTTTAPPLTKEEIEKLLAVAHRYGVVFTG